MIRAALAGGIIVVAAQLVGRWIARRWEAAGELLDAGAALAAGLRGE